MKRTSTILAFSIVAGMAASTMAQDSSLFLDTRDNVTSAGAGSGGQLIDTPANPYTKGQNSAAAGGNSTDRFGTAIINGGGRGAGGVLRLAPVAVTNTHLNVAWPNYDADTNGSTGNLWLYMNVQDDVSGTGDVISSLGINTNITNGPNLTIQRNTISTASFTMFNDATVAAQAGGSPAVPWNGVVNGASNLGSPPSIIGSKAVRVPVTTGPVYAASLGMQPVPASLYRVGQLRLTAGARNCLGLSANVHADNSTYSVKLAVNNLLITRVFQSGGDAVENVSMGYDPFVANGTFGTLDASVSGSVDLNTSAAPDAAVQVRLHGDFGGNGTVSGADLAGFNTAVNANTAGTLTVAQTFLGDFSGNRTVTGADLAGMNAAILNGAACP